MDTITRPIDFEEVTGGGKSRGVALIPFVT